MKYIILLFSVLINSLCFGQNIDFNKIILPDNAENISIEEQLVRIAWKNLPDNDIYKRNINAAKYERTITRWAWLDYFGFQANINEFNIDPSSDVNNRSAFFPRYNFSFNIRFGQFVSVPMQNKIATELYYNQLSMLDVRKLELRMEVLSLYENYKAALEVKNIQIEIMEDMQSAFSFLEEQFKNGAISFENYNQEKILYNRSRLTVLQANKEFELTKINLERMLGMPLEDVF